MKSSVEQSQNHQMFSERNIKGSVNGRRVCGLFSDFKYNLHIVLARQRASLCDFIWVQNLIYSVLQQPIQSCYACLISKPAQWPHRL